MLLYCSSRLLMRGKSSKQLEMHVREMQGSFPLWEKGNREESATVRYRMGNWAGGVLTCGCGYCCGYCGCGCCGNQHQARGATVGRRESAITTGTRAPPSLLCVLKSYPACACCLSSLGTFRFATRRRPHCTRSGTARYLTLSRGGCRRHSRNATRRPSRHASMPSTTSTCTQPTPRLPFSVM